MEVNIVENGQTIETEGEMTAVKGYKGFQFFICKQKNLWQLREFTTGCLVAEHKLKAESKKLAREVLAKLTNKNKKELQKFINRKKTIN